MFVEEETPVARGRIHDIAGFGELEGVHTDTGLLSFESGGPNPGYEATGGDMHKLSDSTALPSPVASP